MQRMIQSMPFAVFVVILAFPVAMTAILVFAGVHAKRRARLLTAMPTSPIGMAADGYREVEGVVEAVDGRTITAPLTRSPCCWYHARVERFVSRASKSDNDEGEWQVVRDATSESSFLVRDGTGACVVDPYGADVTPKDRSVWYGATEEPTDRNPERHLMTALPTRVMEVAGGSRSRFRYTEERIYPDDPLVVLGEYQGGRFDRTADEADQDDEEPSAADARIDEADRLATAAGPATPDPWDDGAIADEIAERAKATRAGIGRGSGKQPFIVAANRAEQHAELSQLGGSAAFGVALLPLAMAALLIWLRWA